MSFGDEVAARWIAAGPAAERLEACAQGLLDARRQRRTMARWSAAERPTSSAEAYAIQEAVAAATGSRTAGWKLGCTSTEMQIKLGSDGPICGRAFEAALQHGNGPITGARADMYCVEAEFAFCMGADLPPRRSHYERADVLAAIATLHPAIEQVESRFTDWQGLPIHDIVADNASHGRLVLGAAIEGWRDLDLPACPIRLRVAGEVVVQGQGSAVLGDPVEALLWLARHLNERGLGLRRGEVVTTGTCTGLTFVPPAASAVVDIDGRWTVSTAFLQ